MKKIIICSVLLFSFLGCEIIEPSNTEPKPKEYQLVFHCSNCGKFMPAFFPKGIRAKGRIVTCPFCECDTEIDVTQ